MLTWPLGRPASQRRPRVSPGPGTWTPPRQPRSWSARVPNAACSEPASLPAAHTRAMHTAPCPHAAHGAHPVPRVPTRHGHHPALALLPLAWAVQRLATCLPHCPGAQSCRGSAEPAGEQVHPLCQPDAPRGAPRISLLCCCFLENDQITPRSQRVVPEMLNRRPLHPRDPFRSRYRGHGTPHRSLLRRLPAATSLE